MSSTASNRAYNFCAGPASLPEPVLRQVQDDMLSFDGQGLSIMEMSHRGSTFKQVVEEAEQDLRELLNINSDYEVLFLQGGASLQFSMIPMNFLGNGDQADYICTGSWSKKAIKEAEKFGHIRVAATSEKEQFRCAPASEAWELDAASQYIHYTPNETIHGVEYLKTPQLDTSVPLIADMSSTILSRPIDVSRFGMIYAGAQKNIGPAGIVIVIIHKALLERCKPNNSVPTLMQYQTYAQHGSMYNTPPTFSWYISGLVFKWLLKQGGLNAVAQVNQRKAERLYQCIDQSDLYSNPVDVAARSWMNIPFILNDADLDQRFLAGADERGLLNLKGHRSVGGMRASLYNAVPEEAVTALIDYMKEFEQSVSS